MGPLVSRRLRSDRTEAGEAAPAPLQADLRIGTELAGYRLEEIIGRGGMGVVYRAVHTHLRRTAALKLLNPQLAAGETFRERFVRESQIAARLSHPNIVTVYDAGDEAGLLYIAMQYVDGTDLASILDEETALEPKRALALLEQVAQGLDAAHALGLVHRDVKPGNVLVDGDRAYLTDFGLTRHASSKTVLTTHGQFVGTLDYMPPEQIQGGTLDARTDVYALGCLLYHALAGGVPYRKESQISVLYAHLQEEPPPLRARRQGLPSGLDAVIAKAMAKARDDRYWSCTELVSAAWAVVEPPATAPPFVPSAAPADAAGDRVVLVADDDASTRAMICVTLGTSRLRFLEAQDPEAAMELARTGSPSLVFLDWSLGGRSGAELCAALRSDALSVGAKIVGLTARGDALDDASVLSAGADHHLRKPFSSLQLLYTVSSLFGQDVLAA